MLDRFADFMAGITECHRYVLRIKNLEMTELGLKGYHMMCLFCLGRSEEGLTAAQLAAMCFEDKAAISRSIADLENGGYVAPADPNVKYRSTLVLTEKGEKLVEFVNGLVEQWVYMGGDGLTDEERTIFYRALGKIAANLREKVG